MLDTAGSAGWRAGYDRGEAVTDASLWAVETEFPRPCLRRCEARLMGEVQRPPSFHGERMFEWDRWVLTFGLPELPWRWVSTKRFRSRTGCRISGRR